MHRKTERLSDCGPPPALRWTIPMKRGAMTKQPQSKICALSLAARMSCTVVVCELALNA